MCGIFGWNYKGHSGVGMGQREALASVLAIGNSTRGDQSWGLYARLGKNSRIVKEVGDICKASFAHNAAAPLLMAHTRYSTHGKITKPNAHPHTAGNIVLCHNGVIFNHEDLNKKYQRSCEVDSQHIAMHLDEGRPFDDLEGYGAIEWVDMRKPDSIFICRMSGGQLSVAGIGQVDQKKQPGVVWSSDDRHLMDALEAARLPYFLYQRLEEGKVYEIKGGKLWTTKHADLTLGERQWTGYSYYQGVTSGCLIGTEHSTPTRYRDTEDDRWEKYVRAAQLARDLGLEQVSTQEWKDEMGEPVTLAELSAVAEQERKLNESLASQTISSEELDEEDRKQDEAIDALLRSTSGSKTMVN